MMHRLLGCLLVLLVLTTSLSAQLQVNFSSSSTPNPGSVVDIDVAVTNFDDIVSFQYFIMWDSTVLSYNSILNVSSALPEFDESSVGTPETTVAGLDGLLTVSWNQLSTAPASVADGTVLFTVRLDVVGDACDETSLSIGNIPPFQNIEVITADFEDIGAVASPLPVMVPGTNCNGNPMGVGLTAGSVSGAVGTEVCVPVTVDNFNDIQSAQGGMSWDPSVLSFSGVQNFGIPGLSEALFNTNNTDAGNVSFVWFDNSGNNPVSLADGTTIFEICFTVVGAPGSSSTLSFVDNPPIEFSDSNGDVLEFFTNSGSISVEMGEPMGLGLIVENITALPGTTTCVSVSVQEFIDVQSAQGGVMWDPAVIQFSEADNFGLPGLSESLFNLTNAANGMLSFVWFDNSGVNPVTLNDGDVIFDLCFDVIGTANQSSTIKFINTPVIEFSNSNGEVIEPFFTQEGVLTVGTVVQPGTFSLNSDGLNLTGGASSGCMDITTENFTDISSMQFSMQWDESVMSFTELNNFNTSLGFSQGIFNQTGSNEIGMSWNSPSGLGETVADGTVLFAVCFDLVCGQTGNFNFVDGSQVSIEIGNGAGVEVPFEFDTVTAFCEGIDPPDCTAITATASIDGVECFGTSSGNITMNLFGGNGDFSCSWTNSAGQALSSNGCNLLNVNPGTYNVTVTSCNGTESATFGYVVGGPNMDINIAETITPPGCSSSGIISVSVTGGTPGYGYQWSNGGTSASQSVSAGSYTLTVTDSNGCQEIETFTVSGGGGSDLSVSADVTPAGCSGGTISIDVAGLGGSGVYTYIWSDNLPGTASQSGLLPNTYSVEITDFNTGCNASASFLVSDETPNLSIIEVESINPSCVGASNGSYDFDITGGCAPHTCQVTNSAGDVFSCGSLNNLPAGVYGINVSDNFGNEFNGSFSLIEPSNPITITLENVAQPSLPDGGQIDVTVSGGVPPYQYMWSDGTMTVGESEDLFGVFMGSYTLTIVDAAGCVATLADPIVLVDPDDPTVPVIDSIYVISDFSNFGVSCNGACDGAIMAEFSDLVDPFIITLIDGAGISTQIDAFPVEGLCAGNYTVTVDNGNGTSTSGSIAVSEPTSMQISQDLDNSSCTELGQSNGSLAIFVNGGVGGYSYSWNPDIGSDAILTGLPVGSYVVQVSDANGCVADAFYNVMNCGEVIDTTDVNCYDFYSTILTPNGDGSNDNLIIECADESTNTIEVYDRWGRLVHEGSNYQNDWGGSDLDGELLNEGGYFWVMEVFFPNGETRIFKGHLTVLRE